MTSAAQAVSEAAMEPLLAAYIASRLDHWPSPKDGQTAEQFLARSFAAQRTGEGFCTGYYEPEVRGALFRHEDYIHPIYRKPPDLTDGRLYLDRKTIDGGALEGKGLEIAWLSDPVDVFFLQIQGSGRIRLKDDQMMRVGFAGKNGHPYQSIGRILVERGVFELEDVTAQSLKAWLRSHPDDAVPLMNANPAYVFFDSRPHLSAAEGPIGTAGVPLTPFVSVAADPDHHPLGSVIYIEYPQSTGLVDGYAVVQDTGGAIKGPNRIDVFTGSGDSAGELAGALKHPIRVTPFAPTETAD